VNAPLPSVVVPPDAPLMLTDTLDSGALLSDTTVPLTVNFPWANKKLEALRRRKQRKKSFFFCSKNANCFFDMAAKLVKKCLDHLQ
jgi:hypothetical protein